jgi:hypothetical protein
VDLEKDIITKTIGRKSVMKPNLNKLPKSIPLEVWLEFKKTIAIIS